MFISRGSEVKGKEGKKRKRGKKGERRRIISKGREGLDNLIDHSFYLFVQRTFLQYFGAFGWHDPAASRFGLRDQSKYSWHFASVC